MEREVTKHDFRLSCGDGDCEKFKGDRGISTFLAPIAKNHFLQEAKGRIACS